MAAAKRICFVCLGNIVRSPLAKNLFKSLAVQAGVGEKYPVDSAGTGPWHMGESPDARMRRVAARHGLAYNGRARQFQPAEFERFDLILAMDHENYNELIRMARVDNQRKKVHMLREFDPWGDPNSAVPDPYYASLDSFEEVFAIIEHSCRGLLEALESGNLE